MKYRLRHTTSYSYSWSVDISHHLLHLGLADSPRMKVHSCRVTTNPEGRHHAAHVDHFGNSAAYLAIEEPHTRFDVELIAELEVQPFTAPPEESTPAWEGLRDQLAGDGFPKEVEACEFALGSPLASADEAIRAYAEQSFASGRPILAAARELTRRIYTDFKYDPDATEVFTPVAEVMTKKAGVCQDFAHLEIAMLRSLGLAARYVSGYIRTIKPPLPGQEGTPVPTELRGADASHAWIGVWCGPDHGWIDLDPTNDLIVSDDHVPMAIGRDYSDVSPVRGVVLGGGPHRISVAVDLVPLTAKEPPAKGKPAAPQAQSQSQAQG